MPAASLPPNEAARLQALRSLNILDTLPEQSYEDLVYLASQVCDTPMAFVSFIDADRQWDKAGIGADKGEIPRSASLCAHAILEPENILVVPDTTCDARFVDNPLVTGEAHWRFYAGAPLLSSGGEALGTLCVADRIPRELSEDQKASLESLSRQVMAQLELRATVQELEVTRKRLEIQSLTDFLTGLSNRRAFDERWSSENARASRYESPVSVLMIDIDNFKGYNDSFGHPAGDELLRAFARLLSLRLRPSDFPARYGGEEFVVILPNTGIEGAIILAEHLRQEVEETRWQFRRVTVSIGVASAPPCELPGNELLEVADKALYEAKNAGRNRVVAGNE